MWRAKPGRSPRGHAGTTCRRNRRRCRSEANRPRAHPDRTRQTRQEVTLPSEVPRQTPPRRAHSPMHMTTGVSSGPAHRMERTRQEVANVTHHEATSTTTKAHRARHHEPTTGTPRQRAPGVQQQVVRVQHRTQARGACRRKRATIEHEAMSTTAREQRESGHKPTDRTPCQRAPWEHQQGRRQQGMRWESVDAATGTTTDVGSTKSDRR